MAEPWKPLPELEKWIEETISFGIRTVAEHRTDLVEAARRAVAGERKRLAEKCSANILRKIAGNGSVWADELIALADALEQQQ